MPNPPAKYPGRAGCGADWLRIGCGGPCPSQPICGLLTHGVKAEKMPRSRYSNASSRAMANDQSDNCVEALGCSKSATSGDDGGLLALGAQLEDLVAQLTAAQEANGELVASSDELPAALSNASG